MLVGLNKTKQYVTSSHTFQKWFSRFMRGARLRMGMIRKQNEALTSNLVLAVCAKAEMKWSEAQEETVKEDVENTVVFMLVALGAGLRGKEVPLLSLEGLLTFWEETRAKEDWFVMLTLKGCFKGKVDERWHLVPVSNFTRSGLPIRLWMERALHHRVNVQRRTKGWLFQCPRGVRSKFGKYDNTFRLLIDLARDRHERLVPVVVETGDFSLWISPRRGAVLEMTNQDVLKKVIELINLWRKKEGTKGSEAGLAMRQVYTQVRSTLPKMLRYSKTL
jgi:hypothetical protein